MLAPVASPPPVAAAPPCTPAQRAGALAPIVGGSTSYALTCSLTLMPGDRVVRTLRLEGAEASGVRVDCQGGALGEQGAPSTVRIDIRSRRESGGGWSRPTDIRIERCTLYGSARLWGMGADDRFDELRVSSRRPDHTARAQAAAPAGATFDRVVFVTRGLIQLYLGPGTTRTTVRASRFEGRVPLAVYLDAESAGNVIEDTVFDLATRREVIAVDGSARNRITGNRFVLAGQGGVFLYRNCGELGVIRHQPPTDNLIAGNRFEIRKRGARTVVVGSRQGKASYCAADAGYPFGSSADDGDHAERNTVRDNLTLP